MYITTLTVLRKLYKEEWTKTLWTNQDEITESVQVTCVKARKRKADEQEIEKKRRK
jgi:hypothetical protein